MTSETPSYLARKNHFQCFDYGKVLQSSAERSEEVDPEIGPYGQTSLGTKKMSEFRRLVNEFESLFSESLSGFTELRSQFDADRTSTTAKQIYQEELIQNSTTTFWYITTGLKLASETFWNTLDFPASNKAASESLKIKWLLHAKWAYLSSPKLVKAKELLQRITLYAQEAEKELKSTEARRNFDPRNISEISVPFFKQASVKNPIHVSSQFPRFSEKYHIYLARLQSQISRVNKSLAEAMLVRLELASESDDLESDDVLYDCAKRIQGLVDPETFRSISLPKDAPRKTLNKEAYQIFPLHILEFGDEVSVARLQKLKWIGAVDGIPCQLTKSPDSQLCITSHHGSYPVNMTPHVHPYDLALFNIAIHNIQHWNQLFPRGSSIEFKSIDFSTLCPLFKSVFLFIKVAAEQLKAPSTQSKEAWVHLLTAKTGQVLDFSHRFLTFMRTKENQLNLNINADYTLLVGEIRDFCDFMAKNTKDLKKNKEILKIFEDTRQPLVDEFFNLLRAKKIAENRGALENCLGLLRSCVSAEHRKHVQVIQKLLFNEDLSSISLQDIRQALESPAFNVPQEKIYAEMKLLIETAYHLRNKKLSPPLVRLVQAFDQEFGPSLVKMITQDNEARVKAAIALLENVDFQLTPYRDILDALTVLSSFRGIASHGRILHNFIDRFLKHYKGQDFLALEMVLLVNSEDQVRAFARARLETILSTDPALLIADETRHGFERIFQCYPSLRDEMSVYVIPLIDGFIANIPRQIEDCMAPPNPPFKVNGLLPGEALEIVNFFLPSKKASYCESIDRPFYSYLEALINHGGSAQKIESFSELLIYNFLSFPESEHFRKKIRESLEILVSRPWTPIGHELCRQFDLVEPRTILAKSRIQLLQKILEDRDGSFNNTLKTLVSSGKIRDLKNITPGLVGICEFYGSENRDRVLNLIELFLQSPIYHPITFELLQTHLSHEAISGEISSPKFDVLSAQFRHISQFQAKTDATLRALRESNFGLFSEFRDDLHIEILRQDQPYQAILSIYIGFLQELEDQLRISLRDQLEDKSKYIIQVFKKSYTSSEEETFRQWLDSEKVPKELFESYCAVLERLDSIAQDANEIKSVFRIIFNIKRLYVSDKDWILEFPQSRIDACLNTLSLGERRQLASALSLLNAEKYHIISKEALSAFRRLLLQETDNPQKEVDLLKDASDVAEANAKFRKLGAGAQKDAFQVELQDKYRKRPQFLATFMQVLMQDSAAELRKREFWENNICALFPAIFESDASQSEQRLVHSFVWGIRQITLEVFSQLFGEDGHLLGAKDYNRHVVTPVHLPHLRAPVGHIKFFPDSPGIQYAARTLSVLLENPLPCHELLKFPSSTAGQQRAYPVSLSEHSSGQPLLGFWNRNEKVKLHPGFFSREFLRVLLTRDVDGLPSNYFVEEVKDSGTYRLVCIEDEAAFGDVVIKKGNKLELMHVSAVYCFDDMNQPLDPEVRKFILSLDIFSFVNSFITDVSNYNNRLSQTDKGSCFFDQEECQFWATHKEHPVVIPFPFLDEKLVRETIRVLSKLQELVHANSQITHIQVLEEIYPELIPYYVPALREAISPKERLDQVLKKGRGDDCLLVHGSYISTRNDTQVYLSHFGHVPSTGELTRKEITAGILAKDTLLSIGKLLEILKPARAALERGDISVFKTLSNDLKQRVLNGIPGSWPPLKLSTLVPATQGEIFQVMLQGGFHILDFSDCFDLPTDLLVDILRNNPLLKSLNLSRCRQLDIPKLLPVIADVCPSLEILRLSELNMSYLDYSGELSPQENLSKRNPINHPFIQRCFNTIDFSQPFGTPLLLQSSAPSMWDSWRGGQMCVFRNLKHLYIDNCTKLESVCLVAPSLERLHARGCSSLNNLRMLIFSRATASLDGCRGLAPQGLLQDCIGLSCYSDIELSYKENQRKVYYPFRRSINIETISGYIRIVINEDRITTFNLHALNYIVSLLDPHIIQLIRLADQSYDDKLLENLLTLLKKSNIPHIFFLGVIEDYDKAENLFRKSADKGFADVQYNLGLLHYIGFPKAVWYFLQAAKHEPISLMEILVDVLDAKVPPPTPASPRSPGAVESIILRPMQNLQQQQSQPAAVPALSSVRASLSTSVEEDLNALVAESLKGVSSSTTRPAAVPRQARPKPYLQQQQSQPTAVTVLSLSDDDDLEALVAETLRELPAAVPRQARPEPLNHEEYLFEDSFEELEQLLLTVISLQIESIIPADFKAPMKEKSLAQAKQLGSIIGLINSFFKSLREASESSDVGLWLEKEIRSPSYLKLHPFATSYFLTLHLEKATCLQPFSNPALIKEWKQNYQRCVLLLKQNGLDAYNKTEFPFSEQMKPLIQKCLMTPERISQDPQLAAKQAEEFIKEFAANPEAMIRKVQEHNPQLAEWMRAQMKYAALLQADLQPHCSFFKNLDQQLKSHSKDKDVIESWLKSEGAKPDYLSPFYLGKKMVAEAHHQGISLHQFRLFLQEYFNLFTSSCQQLVDLGIEHCTHEGPSHTLIAQLRQGIMPKKTVLERELEVMLSEFFRPLNNELRALPASETRDAHRQALEKTLKSLNHRVVFSDAFMLQEELFILEGVLDNVNEFRELYFFCRQLLMELGLNEYLHEEPLVETLQSAKPAAPKKALSDPERFTNELKFFRLMLDQKEATLDAWLKENSPEFDYPLLWGKKRKSNISSYRDSVNTDLRHAWLNCYDTCIENINNSSLRYHLDLEKIPEDASPELRAFLTEKSDSYG